jgi:prevent-host-death family protein
MINIPIAKAHNRLSSLLKKVQKSPILLTRRGEAVGVLMDPEEYEQLRHLKAYLQLLAVSREVREGPGADEIYRASRQELEGRA